MPVKKQEPAAEEQRKTLSWLQLANEFSATLKASLGEPMPGEFWQHMRAGHKEHLLAVRSLIDARIAAIEAKEKAAEARQATKITID